MISISYRRGTVAVVTLAMFVIAVDANAACCGGGTTAFYPSTYSASYAGSYSAYYPSTYQTYYGGTGWYPGYYLNRIRTRLFGSPSTYVAAYPTTAYYASYAPSYSASYAPSYGVSYAPTYATSYAAPAAYSSGSTCQSCTAGYSVQQVTMRPVCTTACAPPCSTCATCAPPVVAQTSYEQPACPTCAAGNASVQVQQHSSSTPSPDPARPEQTFGGSPPDGSASPPSVPADAAETERREKVETNGTGITPDPGPGASDLNGTPVEDPYKVDDSDSSTFFEAPKLHDPNDRTAQRGIAPVKTAIYKQPVAYRNVSAQRVTAEQARQDAVGWTSVAK